VDALARTVRNLENLYAVVVAVGLTLAVQQLISFHSAGVDFQWNTLPAFLAFIVTLVPFYHGAERHLEDAYVDNPRAGSNPRRLLFDFAILFIEACVLLGAAAVVRYPQALIVALIALWVIDVVWGLTARVVFRLRDEVMTWALINSVAVVGFSLLLVVAWTTDIGDVVLALLLFATSLIRTIADYRTSWSFYFPSTTTDQLD
jgi:hypothetical protein